MGLLRRGSVITQMARRFEQIQRRDWQNVKDPSLWESELEPSRIECANKLALRGRNFGQGRENGEKMAAKAAPGVQNPTLLSKESKDWA